MRPSEWTKWLPSAGNLAVMLLVIVAVGLLIFAVPKPAEIQMGLVVVFAIGGLLVLLTVMAAVFHNLKLDDRRQALGLPEGSVRALIALFLIMIFIIMSAYLFRTIAGREGEPITDLTITEVTELQGLIQVFDIQKNDSGTFDVIPKVGVTPAAEQLALQMVTILGTLVTAVSAFYFGSATARASPEPAPLTIDRITPSSSIGAKDGSITAELIGSGFVAGASVKLRLPSADDINGINPTVVDASKITCAFDVSGRTAGHWDVVVFNPDGGQVTKSGIFEITGSNDQ